MQRDDLTLFNWQPSCQVIAFPARRREGHALKVARQLSKARTNREADWILTRALVSYHDKLFEAGVSSSVAGRQMESFKRVIHQRCIAIGSRWMPAVDDDAGTGGAA